MWLRHESSAFHHPVPWWLLLKESASQNIVVLPLRTMGRLRNTDLGISRPASSFAFFVQHCHQRFKAVKKKLRLREKSYAQVPDASNIATRWRTMASPERRPFVEKAQQEAARNRSQRKKTLHDVRCVKLTKQTKGPSASSFKLRISKHYSSAP